VAVIKRCDEKLGCRFANSRCEHPWYFRVRLKEWGLVRHQVDIFAQALGHPRPVTSKKEAEEVWEPKFIAMLRSGHDPRKLTEVFVQQREQAEKHSVGAVLDRFYTEHYVANRVSSLPSIRSRIKILKQFLGTLPDGSPRPARDLESVKLLNWFKNESDYAEDSELASVHRCLEIVRTAINWGLVERDGEDPIFSKSPFHKFGVTMNKGAEGNRDRRLTRDEQEEFRRICFGPLNTAAHQRVGPLLYDRMLGALDLLCRRGEMMKIQNRRVYWDTYQIGIPGENTKDKDNRKVPFDPEGPVGELLKRRKALGPLAYVFGSETGTFVETFQTAWESARLLAYGYTPKSCGSEDGRLWNREKLAEIDLRWHDLRHEGACRMLADGADVRMIQLMLGHSTLLQTQRYLNITDEELKRGMQQTFERRKLALVG